MIPEISERIIGLSNRTYILSIDIVSFMLTLEKNGFQNTEIPEIKKLTSLLSDIVSDLEDKQVFSEIFADIGKSSTFASQIIELLRPIQCKNELLNEKTDVILRTYKLMEEFSEISVLLKN